MFFCSKQQILWHMVNSAAQHENPCATRKTLDVAKTGNSTFFRGKKQIPQQMANSTALHEICMLQNTAGLGDIGIYKPATVRSDRVSSSLRR